MTEQSPHAVAIVTGGARRIGKAIVQQLHNAGFSVVVHYNSSAQEAKVFCEELNSLRSNSAISLQGDLNDEKVCVRIAGQCVEAFGRIDVLVNNASTFYPTPLEDASLNDWDDLMGSNLKAPFFLAQACAQHLRENQGCIVNIVDIYARKPLQDHPIYCAAKAGLEMLTRAFARDLAPHIRVNAVAPGAILWPENPDHPLKVDELLKSVPLARLGNPQDIAQTVLFLATQAPYITGQTIAVDGGRSVMS